MEWYYQQDGERVGPVSEDGFLEAVHSGAVVADSLVWNETMTEWQPYSEAGGAPEPATIPEIPPEPTPTEPLDLPDDDSVVCRECGCVKSPSLMIPFENRWVCADCKDTFFQKIKEGVVLGAEGLQWEPTGGATPNSEIAVAARDCLRGKLMTTYGVLLLYGLCQVYRGIPYMSTLLKLFLKPPFVVGFARYFLLLTDREDKEELVNIYSGFSKYGTCLGAMILRGLAIYAIPVTGLILFVFITGAMGGNGGEYVLIGVAFVCAVIFAFLWFSLFFVEWVLAADEELGVMDSLSRAWRLLSGHRFKLFTLCLRYFWLPILLCSALATTIIALILPGTDEGDTMFFVFIGLIFAIIAFFYVIVFLILPFYFSAVAIFFRDIHVTEYD